MAATLLSTSYLCSDFNLSNLIGVSDDCEEHILVTCRGVVKQYNVREQKQIQSWTTKSWHPFTAAAVCDPETSNVVTVISNSSISQWNHSEDDIDKVKRENFETPIYQLVVSGGSVYVVFSTGQVEELKSALKTRKEAKPGFLEADESITYVDIDKEEDVGVLLVRNAANQLKVLKLQLSQGTSPSSCYLVVKDTKLSGICLVSAKLFTIWSNGNMHCLNLHSDSLINLPGRFCSIVSGVEPLRKLKVLPVAPSHIAIIGADVKDEGGALVLWDVKFSVVTSSRKLKMYHNPPLAWMSTKGIMVVDGGSLSCTPFVIAESTLATIFGSHTSKDSEFEPEVCHGWDTDTNDYKGAMQTIYLNKSEKLVEILKDMNKFSLSESLLVSNVLDPLIEEKHLLLLYEVIMVFEDIPESCLVKVLQLFLKCDDTDFDGLMKYPPMQMECTVGYEEVMKCPVGSGKAHFIEAVLMKPYTDNHLIKELHKLSFEEALKLIEYLYFLLQAGEVFLCPGEYEDVDGLSLAKVSDWLSLLLDSKYHQLVMTSQVTVHRLLLSCFSRLTNMRKLLQDLINLEPLIQRVVEQDNTQMENMSSGGYSLERLIITR